MYPTMASKSSKVYFLSILGKINSHEEPKINGGNTESVETLGMGDEGTRTGSDEVEETTRSFLDDQEHLLDEGEFLTLTEATHLDLEKALARREEIENPISNKNGPPGSNNKGLNKETKTPPAKKICKHPRDHSDDFIIRQLNDPAYISDPHFELLRIDIFEPLCIFEILRQRQRDQDSL